MQATSSSFAALAAAVFLAAASAPPVAAARDHGTYEVTVTNITKAQTFTPLLVVTHHRGVQLFELGAPASEALVALAEGGDTGPLADAARAMRGVHDVATADGPLGPGQSVTIAVRTRGHHDRVSLAGMLVPTNDAFVAIDGVQGPRGRETVAVRAVAYDAGSETNDELCASIPGGGPCGGGMLSDDGEGFVHVHAGIHGVGDLDDAIYDWRNPVAAITIRRR
ncbi:MAG: spondin domain-containing protein [Ectothiorhodospiraceae bacterium]|nr:spondin domain-containing protein [Chromatiales bacterium]MCP5156401.1 spondin domain-containing protein [Ectothiorhodospiraceae bacterium]